MRLNQVLRVLSLSCVMGVGSSLIVQAEDKPSAAKTQPVTQAREKFAKLLLSDTPKKTVSKKATDKSRRVVVNAFGGVPGTGGNPVRGR